MKDKSFSFPLPSDMKEWMEKYALEQDLSLSQVVRMAIREFIKNKEGVQ